MTRLLILACVPIALVASAGAADDTEEQPPQQPSPVFFGEGRNYIDYWNSRWAEKAKSEKKPQNGTDHTPAQSRWSEPAVGEDGQVKTYYPAKQVAELLENPTEENARAYLQWQRERMHRIQEAQRIIEKVKLSLEIDELAKRIKSAGVSVRLDLYVQEGCPHCETQKANLAELVKRMPDLAVRTVELTENPALVRELSIESVPTMIVTASSRSRANAATIVTAGGSSVRKVGVVSQSQLVRLVELLISEPKDEK